MDLIINNNVNNNNKNYSNICLFTLYNNNNNNVLLITRHFCVFEISSPFQGLRISTDISAEYVQFHYYDVAISSQLMLGWL